MSILFVQDVRGNFVINEEGLFVILGEESDRISFVQQPTSGYKRHTIAPPITVQVLDEFEEPVAGVDVELAISPTLDGQDYSGTMIQETDENGIATFDDLKINKSGYYALTAVYNGMEGVSDLFLIRAKERIKIKFI